MFHLHERAAGVARRRTFLRARLLGARAIWRTAPLWLGLMAGRADATSPGVTAEATDRYCDSHSQNCSSIICIAEADNFRNGLLNKSGTIFTPGSRYTDRLVYDTDFVDPERTGHSYDNDTFNFDRVGNGVAYVCLHGTCNDMTGQPCTNSGQCTHPGGGQSLPGVCIGNGPPNDTAGVCGYYADRYLITTADAFGDHYGGWIDYSNGLVRWGESGNAGMFAGAGTNGGINFGLLSNSCGVRPGFVEREVMPLHAGMTVLGIVMPITAGADDVDAPTRGTALANAYVTNPNGSIGHAWADSIVGIPYNDGGGCPGLGGNYQFGGGHGITGCGAQLTHAADSTRDFVLWDRDTETWNQVPNDGFDSLGTQWWATWWHCNYDCNAYPMTL
jgi:hypothetical protein